MNSFPVETFVRDQLPAPTHVVGHHLGVDLRVKLHTPGARSEAHRGMRIERAAREHLRPGWELHHGIEVSHVREKGIVARVEQRIFSQQLELDRADLATERIFRDSPAERLPQQLVAKANAEHRRLRMHHFAQARFGREHPRRAVDHACR